MSYIHPGDKEDEERKNEDYKYHKTDKDNVHHQRDVGAESCRHHFISHKS
jgi:hypothetical protein